MIGDQPGPGWREMALWPAYRGTSSTQLAKTVKEVKGVPLGGHPHDAKHGQDIGLKDAALIDTDYADGARSGLEGRRQNTQRR